MIEHEFKVTMSPQVNEIAASLCKAQSVMQPAKFNCVNPFHKNRYADLASVMEACRVPLTSNGICTTQFTETIGEKIYLSTLLLHVSGQWIKSLFPIHVAKLDCQSIGAAMTYGKRYSLSALVGIVSEEDDDGESTYDRREKYVAPKKEQPKPINSVIHKDMAEDLNKIILTFTDEQKKGFDNFLKQSGFESVWNITLDKYDIISKKVKSTEAFNKA